jgi:hypothetical protein
VEGALEGHFLRPKCDEKKGSEVVGHRLVTLQINRKEPKHYRDKLGAENSAKALPARARPTRPPARSPVCRNRPPARAPVHVPRARSRSLALAAAATVRSQAARPRTCRPIPLKQVAQAARFSLPAHSHPQRRRTSCCSVCATVAPILCCQAARVLLSLLPRMA